MYLSYSFTHFAKLVMTLFELTNEHRSRRSVLSSLHPRSNPSPTVADSNAFRSDWLCFSNFRFLCIRYNSNIYELINKILHKKDPIYKMILF